MWNTIAKLFGTPTPEANPETPPPPSTSLSPSPDSPPPSPPPLPPPSPSLSPSPPPSPPHSPPPLSPSPSPPPLSPSPSPPPPPPPPPPLSRSPSPPPPPPSPPPSPSPSPSVLSNIFSWIRKNFSSWIAMFLINVAAGVITFYISNALGPPEKVSIAHGISDNFNQPFTLPPIIQSLQTFNEIQKLIGKTNGKVVGDLMTPAPLVVQESTNLEDAARLLLETNYRQLPVVDGAGKLVGIITRGNIVRTLLQIKRASEKST